LAVESMFLYKTRCAADKHRIAQIKRGGKAMTSNIAQTCIAIAAIPTSALP